MLLMCVRPNQNKKWSCDRTGIRTGREPEPEPEPVAGCEPVFLGPDMGYVNIMQFHDEDGTCTLSMAELATLCTLLYKSITQASASTGLLFLKAWRLFAAR